MDYGLIGKKLGHSFSAPIHEELGGYRYQLRELPDETALAEFLRKREFKAINVTIPYKQAVMPACAYLDPAAKAIGAVNTIVNRNGVLSGYNTDYAGARRAMRRGGVELADRVVLILGTGGTRRTFSAIARDEGAREILVAGRSGGDGVLTYGEAARRADVQVVLNASPAGMWPHNGECLVDLSVWPALESVFDAVYNPLETRLLWQAKQRGLPAVNGLAMLVGQAKYASEHFTGRSIPDEEIDRVHRTLLGRLANLVLVGMPGCGKTRIGRLAAQALGRDFVDMDAEIEKAAGMSIPDIFSREGEQGFRDRETRVAEILGARTGLVIATGGGAVLRGENVRALRQNGVIVYMQRSLDQLAVGGNRPLSSSREALEKMLAARAPLYEAAAHRVVFNTGGPPSLARRDVLAAFRQALDAGVL